MRPDGGRRGRRPAGRRRRAARARTRPTRRPRCAAGPSTAVGVAAPGSCRDRRAAASSPGRPGRGRAATGRPARGRRRRRPTSSGAASSTAAERDAHRRRAPTAAAPRTPATASAADGSRAVVVGDLRPSAPASRGPTTSGRAARRGRRRARPGRWPRPSGRPPADRRSRRPGGPATGRRSGPGQADARGRADRGQVARPSRSRIGVLLAALAQLFGGERCAPPPASGTAARPRRCRSGVTRLCPTSEDSTSRTSRSPSTAPTASAVSSVAPAGADRQPGEQRPLGLVEQVVAPGDGGPQRPLPVGDVDVGPAQVQRRCPAGAAGRAGGSVRTRAATSSTASGSPSSRRTTSATRRGGRRRRRRPGRPAGPGRRNSWTAAAAATSPGRLAGRGTAERTERHVVLAAQPQQAPAGHQQLGARAPREQPRPARAPRRAPARALSSDSSTRPPGQPVGDQVQHRTASLDGDADRRGDRPRHVGRGRAATAGRPTTRRPAPARSSWAAASASRVLPMPPGAAQRHQPDGGVAAAAG